MNTNWEGYIKLLQFLKAYKNVTAVKVCVWSGNALKALQGIIRKMLTITNAASVPVIQIIPRANCTHIVGFRSVKRDKTLLTKKAYLTTGLIPHY